MVILVLLWVMCGFGAGLIASSKGGSFALGFVVGFLFGPFGLLFALFMGSKNGAEQAALNSGEKKKCPQCAELVQREAKVCRFCQHGFAEAPAA